MLTIRQSSARPRWIDIPICMTNHKEGRGRRGGAGKQSAGATRLSHMGVLVDTFFV